MKRAYGDEKLGKKYRCKVKVTDVKEIGPLWSMRDSNRLIEGLASVINAMADLMKLSKQHNIEGRLYNGDALDILYGMLGERSVTRWLGQIMITSNDNNERLWKVKSCGKTH